MDEKNKEKERQKPQFEKAEDKKTNEELFKRALIEGLNNRFQKEIDSSKE